MHISPHHSQLRVVALICWAFSGWFVVQIALADRITQNIILTTVLLLASVILLALGVSFWLLGTDKQAGISFDSKGMLLNLSYSTAFINWEDIDTVEVCQQKYSLLALGSCKQLGLRLKHVEAYVQSYEPRLPASRGIMGHVLRWLQQQLRSLGVDNHIPKPQDIANHRKKTGYDVLVPETQLGGKLSVFMELVAVYHKS